MKKIIENSTIRNLYSYLKRTDADEIIVRTTRVEGGWHDNEFDANAAGFSICRFINPEYVENHTFAECYKLTRR
jgi:hypothetical protein